jgi:polyhydroxyalkanoate synthesis regulator phasin
MFVAREPELVQHSMEHENKSKPMTLDRLAGMVTRGFENSATKDDLNRLEKKVDRIDYQVDELHDVLKRFEETDILNLQRRVQVLEKAVRALANQSK